MSLVIKNKSIKDKKLRGTVNRLELYRFVFNFLISSHLVNIYIKYYIQSISNFFFKGRGFTTKINNRCIVSGRAHAVLRNCRLSRIKFKQFVGSGLLYGYKGVSR